MAGDLGSNGKPLPAKVATPNSDKSAKGGQSPNSSSFCGTRPGIVPGKSNTPR
jgi:hypothetical protein